MVKLYKKKKNCKIIVKKYFVADMTLPSVSAKRLIKYLLEFSRTCWASPEGNNVGRLALYCRRIPKSMFTSYKLYNDNFFCLLIFVWNLFSSSSSSSGCSCPLILTPMLLVNKSQSLNKGTNRLCSFFHTSSPIFTCQRTIDSTCFEKED